jgi:DNA adenine methylase
MYKREELFFPFDDMIKVPGGEDRTILIYYGGKSRDADWIIANFPPEWMVLVDVFGGGGAISFRVGATGKTLVYNDIGNVSNFMKVMREYPDELYRQLYFTPYGRDEYDQYGRRWAEAMQEGDMIEWARRWFICINQGYAHTEDPSPWKVSMSVDNARAFSNHVDDLPRFVKRLKRLHVENQDFATLIKQYDKYQTLFYCDPPYLHETREAGSRGTYLNEMTIGRHVELLNLLDNVKGQVVLSGYACDLYDNRLHLWRTATKIAKSSIQNRASMDDRGTRIEKLWIKEHNYGLWGSL